jgi:flagellar FliL protein
MAAPKADSSPKGADAAAASAPTVIAPSAPAKRGGIGAWIPVILAIVLAPVATWATVEFVMLPRLQKKIATAGTEEPAEAAVASEGHGAPKHGGKEGKDGKGGKESAAGAGYEFQNVVVNLAGTMGTRYLKTSFLVTPAAKDTDIKAIFEGSKPRLTDVTLNVLSSLTLADLEEPGAKNIIREKLVMAYNQALGKKIADQVYFSDFVIQ